jgi:hypothetical protein
VVFQLGERLGVDAAPPVHQGEKTLLEIEVFASETSELGTRMLVQRPRCRSCQQRSVGELASVFDSATILRWRSRSRALNDERLRGAQYPLPRVTRRTCFKVGVIPKAASLFFAWSAPSAKICNAKIAVRMWSRSSSLSRDVMLAVGSSTSIAIRFFLSLVVVGSCRFAVGTRLDCA